MEKNIKARVVNKHDTEENWSKANFIPKKGETIIYDPDTTHIATRMKIGDGVKTVSALPFIQDGFFSIVEETDTLEIDSEDIAALDNLSSIVDEVSN